MSTLQFLHSLQIVLLLLVPCTASLPNQSKDPTVALYEEETPNYVPSSFVNDPKAIKLWPNDDQVPSERPGEIGNESMDCSNGNCRIRNVTIPTLIPYLVPSSDAAMVVAPGGGYQLLSYNREGSEIAKWLNSLDISAFVLKYRVPDRQWLPFGAAPLMDAQRAIGMVRSMASSNKELPSLNTSKVGFMGFSAGGHLTGHLNVAWAERTYPVVDEADALPCRPDFSIMVYPWRSVSQPPVNEPISGASALNVTQDTPPTFLVQTQDDHVHVENAIYYYLALKNANVSPSELHVYPNGDHGYGTCLPPIPTDLEVCTWTDRAAVFLQTLGVAKKKKETTRDVEVEPK